MDTSTVPVVAGESDVMKEIKLAGFAGKYVITWSQMVNEVNSIFARVFTSDLGWGTIESLENGTGETQLQGFTIHETLKYSSQGWSNEKNARSVDDLHYPSADFLPAPVEGDRCKP
jgi:hypothetical protein